MAVVTTNLGTITAYGDAVAAGYTGTKAQWQALMANYATVGQQAAQDAQTASQAAQTATTKAGEASQSATAAAASAASITTPDATLTQAGVAADAKATGDEISDLKEDLNDVKSAIGDITGNKIIDAWNNGYILNTSGSSVDFSSPVQSATWGCQVIDCSEGDTFVISGHAGHRNYRLWCWCQSDGTIVSKPSSNLDVTGLQITCPENATKLVINVELSTPHSVYKNELIGAKLDDTINQVSNTEKSCISSFINGGSYDILSKMSGVSNTIEGITFAYDNENRVCQISGTATSATFSDLYNNALSFPTGIKPGGRYYLKHNSNRVYVRILAYVNGTNPQVIFESLKNSFVTIPTNASGLIIRLHVANQAVVNETIDYPKLVTAPTNTDLYENALINNSVNVSGVMRGKDSTVNGINFVFNGNGTCSVTGTASSAAFNNLYYNASGLPEEIIAGKSYRLKYSAKKVFFRVFAFVNGDAVLISETIKDTKFTIPPDATGIIFRLHVKTGVTVSETFRMPVLMTAFSNQELTDLVNGYASEPMLTIIDDDGDVHFKYDLLPLIDELNVPIASAVTVTRIEDSESGVNPRWMTWDQIRECANGGAEIVSHMYSHPTPEQIADMSLDEIAHRLYMAKNCLKSNGVDSSVLVYSFGTGSTGEKLHSAAERVFDCGFSNTANATPVYSDADRYDLPRYCIDNVYNYDIATMKSIIDTIVNNGGWAVWMIHTSSGYTTTGYWRALLDSQGNMLEQNDEDGTGNYVGKVRAVPALKEAINYAKSLGVKIVTAEYGIKKYFKEKGRMLN